jgi:hypothetical protein
VFAILAIETFFVGTILFVGVLVLMAVAGFASVALRGLMVMSTGGETDDYHFY